MTVLRRSLLILALTISASTLAMELGPIADQGLKVDLDAMIAKGFVDWKIDTSIAPIAANPDVQARLDEIYNQQLSRTYINSQGRRIMLSIAYGGDQSEEKSQVHLPEYCYAAQGFHLSDVKEGQLSTSQVPLTVRRMLATQGNRTEPITYWITIDDKVTLPGLGRKLIQLRYGMTGKVPDGMLVRVSSIDADGAGAYQLQDQFVSELLGAINKQDRVRLAGRSVQ